MKAVLRRTGIAPETLRAWERRYQAVTPARSASGRRLYSDREIERLATLSRLVKLGQSIGQIARLPDRELNAMALSLGSRREGAMDPEVGGLLEALSSFDLKSIGMRLARIRYESSPRDFMFLFIPRVMTEVGRLIDDGRLSVAQEHALSELVQNHLRQVYESLASLDGTRVPRRALLFATPEGHLHEIGLMMVATLARLRGFTSQYLGPNLPAKDLGRACLALKPNAVVLSVSWLPKQERKIELSSFLKETLDKVPRSCDLWIGGTGSDETRPRQGARRIFVFESLEDYEQKLARI